MPLVNTTKYLHVLIDTIGSVVYKLGSMLLAERADRKS